MSRSNASLTFTQVDGTTTTLDIPTGDTNVQSDWGVTDTTDDAFIKRKPTDLVTTTNLFTQILAKATGSKNAGDILQVDNAGTGFSYLNPGLVHKAELQVLTDADKANPGGSYRMPESATLTHVPSGLTAGFLFEDDGDQVLMDANKAGRGWGRPISSAWGRWGTQSSPSLQVIGDLNAANSVWTEGTIYRITNSGTSNKFTDINGITPVKDGIAIRIGEYRLVVDDDTTWFKNGASGTWTLGTPPNWEVPDMALLPNGGARVLDNRGTAHGLPALNHRGPVLVTSNSTGTIDTLTYMAFVGSNAVYYQRTRDYTSKFTVAWKPLEDYIFATGTSQLSALASRLYAVGTTDLANLNIRISPLEYDRGHIITGLYSFSWSGNTNGRPDWNAAFFLCRRWRNSS